MVMAQSLFITLKQRDEEAIIDVIGPNWSLPILARMPQIRQAIPLPTGHGEWGISTRRKLGYSLRSERYDHAIVMPRSWKSALVPFFAKVPHRVGFTGEQRYVLLNERRKLDKSILNQTVKRFPSLALPKEPASPLVDIPSPALSVNADNQKSLYQQHNLAKRPAIALMAGAEFAPSKQWPIAYFHELAKSAIESGYQIWVLGGPKDASDGEIITKGLGEFAHNLCGKTQLVDAIDLLAAAEKAVSNDSGLMHIAAALDRPLIALYGSSSAHFTPPLSHQVKQLSLSLDCSPCFKRNCPLTHFKCLRDLAPQQVMQALQSFGN